MRTQDSLRHKRSLSGSSTACSIPIPWGPHHSIHGLIHQTSQGRLSLAQQSPWPTLWAGESEIQKALTPLRGFCALRCARVCGAISGFFHQLGGSPQRPGLPVCPFFTSPSLFFNSTIPIRPCFYNHYTPLLIRSNGDGDVHTGAFVYASIIIPHHVNTHYHVLLLHPKKKVLKRE